MLNCINVVLILLDAIEWFRNIKYKSNTTFIEFDIKDFHLSISRDLLRWEQMSK